MRGRTIAIIFGGLLLLMVSDCLGIVGQAALTLFVTTAFGWVAFIARVSPKITVNLGGIAMAGIALVASGVLAHWVGAWLWNSTHADKPWRVKWTFSFLLLVVTVFGAGIATVGITHQSIWLARTRGPWFTDEVEKRIKCSSNLRGIGQAIVIYAKAHGGRYPDALSDLLAETELTAQYFVCPSSKDETAEGLNVQEVLQNLAKPGHMSYIYVGLGLTSSAPDDTVVAYEPLSNHDSKVPVGNVLFADGHVEFESKPFFDKLTTRPATAP